MDAATLADAMGHTLGTHRSYEKFVTPFNEAMRRAHITTVDRAAMWCAQLGHESVGLRYMREIASGAAYEGRADLGNVREGDGVRFAGRGPIQITGRNNYTRLSRWAHEKGYVPTPNYFVDHPTELEKPEHGFLGAVWYWTQARNLNAYADAQNVTGATEAINGGHNGLRDRKQRYAACLELGARLLPSDTTEQRNIVENVIDYPRRAVKQDTIYNCGPASAQTVILARTSKLVSEKVLGRAMGTSTRGTDHVGQVCTALNHYLPHAKYVVVEMPNDPPTDHQSDALWDNITASIDAGYGVVANIVAPPSNYPKAVAPSTISPAYAGGTVYHYIVVMGYSDEGGIRKLWVADSGFPPYGYWISHEQLCSLIPPKGYAYATAQPKTTEKEQQMTAAEDNQQQLRGPNLEGWDQLGGRSVVDALAAIGEALDVEGMKAPRKVKGAA